MATLQDVKVNANAKEAVALMAYVLEADQCCKSCGNTARTKEAQAAFVHGYKSGRADAEQPQGTGWAHTGGCQPNCTCVFGQGRR